MTEKAARTSDLLKQLQSEGATSPYDAFFVCFNRGRFYEAHDVLEPLWLAQRALPNGVFYQGLIQLAGAFVHLQRHTSSRPRLKPAAALFKLAGINLAPFRPVHETLDIDQVELAIDEWIRELENHGFTSNPLDRLRPPLFQQCGELPRRLIGATHG